MNEELLQASHATQPWRTARIKIFAPRRRRERDNHLARIRLRDVIGVGNMMWGSDYPHSESTFPQSRRILAEILAGVPDDEQAEIAGGNTARV